MYEQNDVPVFRRIIWIGLWLLVVIAAVFVLIWFVFFHKDNGKVVKPAKTTTHQSTAGTKSQSSSKTSGTIDTNDNGNSSTKNSSATGSVSPPAPAASTPSTTNQGQSGTVTTPAPTELVNTGAGNVIAPVIVAAVSGTVLYNIRLRRKLLH